MFKFFRNLRRKLLLQKQFRKYLVYALGEVFLVVVGILIALQVNNWSSNQKDNRIRDAYLLQLQNEATSDLERLEEHLQNAQNYIRKAEDKYLSKGKDYVITMQDLNDIGIMRQTFFISDDTYTEIISNGQLNLLPDNIKSALMELSSLSDKINRIDDKAANSLNAQQLKMADFFEIRRLSSTNQYAILADNNSIGKEGLLVYKNYINFSYDWMKTQVFFYGLLKEKYLNLIEQLAEIKH